MDSDSDFYGDQDEINELESRLSSFNPSTYWSNRRKLTMETPSLFTSAPSYASPPSSSSPSSKLHNPYEGRPHCAKQLSESPQTFLTRLPPSTTDFHAERVPWIYVANPFIPRRPQCGNSSGEEEIEAPAEAGMQLGGFMEGGKERLELLGDFLRTVEMKMGSTSSRGRGGSPQAAVNREVVKERQDAVDDILMLARMLKVRTGKWMLFIPPTQVDEVWSAVVHATLQNQLGIAAKVAPRAERGSTRDRLICVYTYDFGDKADVVRVLVRLRELSLVKGQTAIYYKADAYTYLGIASQNTWGIRASIYSSKDKDSLATVAQLNNNKNNKKREPEAPPTLSSKQSKRRKMTKEDGEGDRHGESGDGWSF